MADGKQRERWAHTSSLMALIVNVNTDTRKHGAAKPADFNPFAPKPTPMKMPVTVLKKVFLNPQRK